MKIGILTFHRAHNYGAVLQCYALQNILREISGQEVEVIDYRQPYIEDNYTVFSIRQLIRKTCSLRFLISYIHDIKYRRIRKRNFEDFCCKHLRLSAKCTKETIPLDYDAYIIGSDQLWSANLVRGVDEVYWGQYPVNAKGRKYTYAVSSNIQTLNLLGNMELTKYVNNFSTLSFREKNICDEIASLTGKICRQDIDPVLLTREEDWYGVINEKWSSRNFILIYQIGFPEGNRNYLLQKAREIGEYWEAEIIDVTDKKVSPEEFVSLFKYAKLVLTTSFHGTAFSIIFNTPFFTFSVNDVIDMRSKNLLNNLGLNDNFTNVHSKLVLRKSNYSDINRKLEIMRENSLDYLKSIIYETASCCK